MHKQEAENNDPIAFDIQVGDLSARVTTHLIKSFKVFHLVYSSSLPELNVTTAVNADGDKFWTSVPEGRQEEAELAGKAIAAYLREYRRNQPCAITTGKRSATPSLFD